MSDPLHDRHARAFLNQLQAVLERRSKSAGSAGDLGLREVCDRTDRALASALLLTDRSFAERVAAQASLEPKVLDCPSGPSVEQR